MYISRFSEATVRKLNNSFKILYVGGPRQVGKTTMLKRLAVEYGMGYVSLDDRTERRRAQEDPSLFLAEHPAPLLIDEVQYAPELFSYLKLNVDAGSDTGQYWITGSEQFSLMKGIQESLAGRVAIIHLLGFSSAEISARPWRADPFIPVANKAEIAPLSLPDLWQSIHRGYYPLLWQKKQLAPADFYAAYVQTYIDRDISGLFGVTKTVEFHTLLRLLAARTGQLLNISELARDADISVNAARQWVNMLVATLQVHLLRPYYRNISKRMIKAPKVYFLDTGLAAYLVGWQTPAALLHSTMAGAFFESFVVSEVIKSYLFRGLEPPLSYFRDKEGHEVDLIIERDQVLHPIEIKYKRNLHPTDAQQLRYFFQKAGPTQGTIIAPIDAPFALTRDITALPLSVIN